MKTKTITGFNCSKIWSNIRKVKSAFSLGSTRKNQPGFPWGRLHWTWGFASCQSVACYPVRQCDESAVRNPYPTYDLENYKTFILTMLTNVSENKLWRTQLKTECSTNKNSPASSRTRKLQYSSEIFPLSSMSTRRPGVATRRWQPRSKSLIWSPTLAPP